MDLCQLINAVKPAEHLALKNMKKNSFREYVKAGKMQKEKKELFHLVPLFIVTFILHKAITKDICELVRLKALKTFLSHNFATLKL